MENFILNSESFLSTKGIIIPCSQNEGYFTFQEYSLQNFPHLSNLPGVMKLLT